MIRISTSQKTSEESKMSGFRTLKSLRFYSVVFVTLLILYVWILADKRPSPLLENSEINSSDAFHQLISQAESYLSVEDIVSYDGSLNNGWDGASNNFLNIDDTLFGKQKFPSANRESPSENSKNCQMNTCFNLAKCQKQNFKVYVYPTDKFVPISSTYEKIVERIKLSNYYTSDASQACLFVLSIDTLERDELSHNFVRSLPSRLQKLQYWNNGENHIIFNLYAGTWPSYSETELGFNFGKAILAKASMSVENYRPNFDISIPLFHPSHPDKGDDLGTALSNEFPAHKRHLIAFKGKRYVYGIGSETRNSIYHLHNGNDIIMVTTCKHGKNWKEMKDERCDEDNNIYDRYDYETLLQNSTFCLVPRGRRLGSFRFLESLKAGCIPVLLSNGWILPFSEVIDWKAATIMGDERNLLQILETVRSINISQIFALKQQTQIIWNQYLSSVEKIIETTFEIIRDRIKRHTWRDGMTWNSAPGALSFQIDYSDDVNRFPFHHDGKGKYLRDNFTAVIYVQPGTNGLKSSSLSSYSNSPLFRLVKNAGKSRYISKILIIWDSGRAIPKIWPEVPVPLTIKRSSFKSISQRFITDDEIETEAVFSLDEDLVLSTDELDFAYQTWRSFPDRIVGYQTRSHYWDDPKELWRYSSKSTNDYSLVLAGGAVYHVYYNHIYWEKVPPAAQILVESLQNCEDILLNLLATKITRKPPIKLTSKRNTKDSLSRSSWNDPEHFKQRHNCLNELSDIYGSISLRRSNLRLDPVLFRDPVSNMRKKYRQIEL